MNITEKVSYIKGLAEGLAVDDSTKEGKVILAMIDVLNDIALTLEDIDGELDEVAEVASDLEESVCDLEDEIYGTEDDEDEYDDEYDDEYEDDMYEITCPKCNNTLTVDYGVIEEGSILCPNCGEHLEFEVGDEETDE